MSDFKKEIEQIDTEALIRKAMDLTLEKYKIIGMKKYPHKNPDETLEITTAGQCKNASIDTLVNLHNSGFRCEKEAIITARDISTSSPFAYSTETDGGYHSYFLIKNRGWFAASPANHKKDSSYAQTLFSGHDLSNVIKQIEERDGLIFPDGGEIEKILGTKRSTLGIEVNIHRHKIAVITEISLLNDEVWPNEIRVRV